MIAASSLQTVFNLASDCSPKMIVGGLAETLYITINFLANDRMPPTPAAFAEGSPTIFFANYGERL
jgi:hypothetical protein